MLKIINGLKSGAVLQRNEENECHCYFKASSKGEIKTNIGQIVKLDESQYLLQGILVGGPYTITLSDDESRICVSDIYVGDVWILAGQSNMEGAGKRRQRQIHMENNPIPSIRAYYMNETWDVAKPQLHQLWESVDQCVRETYIQARLNSPWGTEFPETQTEGVGPGLYYAREMQRKSNGIPQGVIPCGIGGSNLKQWHPNDGDNYYSAMKRRFHECGGNVRGIFWYQGESQTFEEVDQDSFISDMQHLVSSMRKDFGNIQLPFVQVQIHCCRIADKHLDMGWTRIREMQRTLEEYIENMQTIYSVDCGLDDIIHLSSESQEKIGIRAAEAMHYLITGEGVPSPQFYKFEIAQNVYVPFRTDIVICYKNIVGGLTSLGIPSGFSIFDEKIGEPIRNIARIDLEGNSLRLVVEIEPENLEDYCVCYGYGNTFYCNITDQAGRSIPAMGPLKIKDYLTEI